jgi:tetratricopeptide (TPR) repeat protein
VKSFPPDALPPNLTRWERVQELFHAASELPPEAASSFLNEACPDEPDLRSEVERLLNLSPDTSLTSAVYEESALLCNRAGFHPGDQMGAYTIERAIGRGGMGEVYSGFRGDGQYRKHVAIKLVRPEISGVEVLQRFRTERQILANLDHPNIARLLDGGMTPSGSPYLVMEYVDGKPLDLYCDTAGLSLRERLRLFLPICSAVQFAHRSLVIHRDLKPSNILVTPSGVPKLLDFGIAKLLAPGLEYDSVPVTLLNTQPMTLEFASPEQVRGEPSTAATDIFALGILLYKILSGQRPYETSDTHPAEAQRRICEEEPPNPSVHNPLIGRELDAIIRMAIRKEPAARYSSVEMLSADIQNLLDGFPVAAAKGNAQYRALKFFRRHKLGVGLGAAAMVTVIGFGIGMAVLASKFAHQRDLAKVQEARAEQVASFLTGMFKAADPFQAKGQTVTAKQLLDLGSKQMDQQLRNQPAVRARLLEVMAVAYQHLGALSRAEELFQAGVENAKATYGPVAPQTAQALRYLGDIERQMSKMPEAENNLRASLAVLDALPSSSDLEKAHALNDLGLVVQSEGKPREAENLIRRAIQLSSRYPAEASETLAMKSNLGSIQGDLARYSNAESTLRQVLQQRRRLLGENHPQVATSTMRLAFLLEREGAYAESEILEREALTRFQRAVGDQHFDYLIVQGNLAALLQETGRTAEAEALFRRIIAIGQRTLPPDQVSLALWKSSLGSLLTQKQEWTEAGSLFRESMDSMGRGSAPQSKNTARMESDFGRFLLAQGKTDAAEPLFTKALAIRLKSNGEKNPATADCQFETAMLRTRQNRFVEAEPLFRQALQTDRDMLKPDHLQTASHLLGWGQALTRNGRAREAIPVFQEVLKIRSTHMPKETWPVQEALSELRAN